MPITLKQGPKLHKLPSSQHALLDAIWRKYGGLRASAKKIGVPEYQLNVWRKRGKVPMNHIKKVAEALDIPWAALNYADVTNLLGNCGKWDNIVRQCNLAPSVINSVLKFKQPKDIYGTNGIKRN